MQASLLAGGRLHLNDGPIDLIVEARGLGSYFTGVFGSSVGKPERLRQVMQI